LLQSLMYTGHQFVMFVMAVSSAVLSKENDMPKKAGYNWKWRMEGGFLFVHAPFHDLQIDERGSTATEIVESIPMIIEIMWNEYHEIMNDPINKEFRVERN
jgi:hypothetical protein